MILSKGYIFKFKHPKRKTTEYLVLEDYRLDTGFEIDSCTIFNESDINTYLEHREIVVSDYIKNTLLKEFEMEVLKVERLIVTNIKDVIEMDEGDVNNDW